MNGSLKSYSLSSPSQIGIEQSFPSSSTRLVLIYFQKTIFFLMPNIFAGFYIFTFPLQWENLPHLHTFNHNFYSCGVQGLKKPILIPDLSFSIQLCTPVYCCCFLLSVTLILAPQNSTSFCLGTSNAITSLTLSRIQM